MENRLYETLKGSQYFVADSATKRARTLKISEGSLHAITVKLHVADSRNPLQGKSDPSKRHKFPMRATSYCGRGTGEKEINRYGQKERTQGKGSEGSANRNSFRVSDGHSKLPGITPATHLQPTESWHSVHVTQTVCQGIQTNQDRIFHFILISGLHSNKMERQLSIRAAEMFTRGNQNALRYRSRLVVRYSLRFPLWEEGLRVCRCWRRWTIPEFSASLQIMTVCLRVAWVRIEQGYVTVERRKREANPSTWMNQRRPLLIEALKLDIILV